MRNVSDAVKRSCHSLIRQALLNGQDTKAYKTQVSFDKEVGGSSKTVISRFLEDSSIDREGENVVMFVLIKSISVLFLEYTKCKCRKHHARRSPKGNDEQNVNEQMTML
jgi:hypothetical protein